MAYNQQILEALSPWQSLRFRDSEIPLKDAASSLSSTENLVIAKPVGKTSTRWMLYRANTEKVALFCHAGVWAWNSPLSTGNYVPEGQSAPEGLPEGRIQNQPNYKCELAYAFDTSVDDSLWKHFRIFEDHVKKQPNFNKGSRKRRSWQSGVDPSTRTKYVMGAKLFARRTPLNAKDANTADGQEYLVPYEIHPWILEGLRNFPELHQVPNPHRPMYYDLSEGVLRKLKDTNEPVFQKNDIVRVVFSMAFIIGGINWYPEVIPIEFTRVGKLPGYMTASADLSSFPSISADFTPLEIGSPVTLINLPVTLGKRKASEDPSTDSHIDKKSSSVTEDSKEDSPSTTTKSVKANETTDTDTVMTDSTAEPPPTTESTELEKTDDPDTVMTESSTEPSQTDTHAVTDTDALMTDANAADTPSTDDTNAASDQSEGGSDRPPPQSKSAGGKRRPADLAKKGKENKASNN
ncbi:hypothetical protein CVT26_011003 [Gymnopilus dilepis]|uniref:Uncharacterized protein n=1 Tax=Gymnopilus dilepis TaxID=231916 RepID=A0A409VY95_9AGAR|nr:hypothetical protein CVT26_011003 [Gymnopilus dilepis]